MHWCAQANIVADGSTHQQLWLFNLDEHVKQFDKNCAVRGFTQEAAAWLGSGLNDTLDRKNLLRRKHFQVTHNANMITFQTKACKRAHKKLLSSWGSCLFTHSA